MKKLIIKMPRGKDATLLLTTAFALAHYRTTTSLRYETKIERDFPFAEFNDYAVEANCLEPEWVMRSASEHENYLEGVSEYEVDAGLIDVFVLETLAELQTLIPFEMYFENRGNKLEGDGDYHEVTEIRDDALNTLYFAEPAVYATDAQIKQWRARQKKVRQLPDFATTRTTAKVKAAFR